MAEPIGTDNPKAGMAYTSSSLLALLIPPTPAPVTLALTSGANKVPEKSSSLAGQNGPTHMAAGLANTALMASWGAAMPTPPMALDIGPTPIRLSPLVAIAGIDNRTARIKTTLVLIKNFIFSSSKKI